MQPFLSWTKHLTDRGFEKWGSRGVGFHRSPLYPTDLTRKQQVHIDQKGVHSNDSALTCSGR